MFRLFIVFCIFLMSSISVYAKDLRFAQVSGVLFNPESEQSVTSLKTLVNEINRQKKVQFVVFTGNNICRPDKKYLDEFIKTVKKIKKPCYLVLGSKDADKLKNLSKKEYVNILKDDFPTHRRIKSPNYVFEKSNVVFIAVDGSKDIIPDSMGYYKEDVLKWLDEQLTENSGSNVVILQHFPLISPTGNESGCAFKPENYMELLSRHKNVKAVIAGHSNVNSEQESDGIVHISTSNFPEYRIIDMLDCESDKPMFWSVIKKAGK